MENEASRRITWECRAADREFFERELEDFVPPRVYDAHAHLWRATDWQGREPEIVRLAPPEMTLECYRDHMAWILPGRDVHGLHFAFPTIFPNDPVPCNEWVGQQVKKDKMARGHFYLRPADDPDHVRQEVKRLGLHGFKPYAGFAERPDKKNAEIPEYFPEWAARIAGEEGWTVTLHMQRPRSLADASNQHWIRTYCERYPDMLLILDHAARGFNPYHAAEGLHKLADLPNLFVETSAVCNPLAIIACIQSLGPTRVMYASDFFVSHMRATNLPFGDSFLWLDEDSPAWKNAAYRAEPVLLGLENLRAARAAFEVLGLGQRDVEHYFWDNAASLFDL